MDVNKGIQSAMKRCEISCLEFVQNNSDHEVVNLMLAWMTKLEKAIARKDGAKIALYQMAVLGLYTSTPAMWGEDNGRN